MFCSLLIVILLIVSWESCIYQWRFYVSVGRPRLKGCFSNPNSLGGISACTLIMCLIGRPAIGKGPWLRRLGIALSSATMMLSGSRTSMLMVVGFFAMSLYQLARTKSHDSRVRTLLFIGSGVLVVAAFFVLRAMLRNDTAVSIRLRSLLRLSGEGAQFLFGLGYMGSKDISTITSAAGGVVDMLPVSLFYRVGVVGIFAYCLLLYGTHFGVKPENITFYFAFLFAVLLQGVGESYLSSVMSYPSCFIWVLLSALPLMSWDEGSVGS